MNGQEVLWVVAAILKDLQGKILIVQRPHHKPQGGLWEFPGGKVEPNEHPDLALVRELKEEVGIVVLPEDLTPFTFLSHRYPEIHMIMLVYFCEVWEGEIQLCEGQGGMAWIDPQSLEDYPLPKPDLPLIPLLKAMGKNLPSETEPLATPSFFA